MPQKDPTKGFQCPVCGAFDMHVSWTTPAIGHISRKRKCNRAGCNGTVSTIERLVGISPDLTYGQVLVRLDEIARRVSQTA